MENQKNYVGNCWEANLPSGDKAYNIQLDPKKVESLSANEGGYITVSITPKKEIGKNKATHSVYEPVKGDKFNTINISVKKESVLNIVNDKGYINVSALPYKNKETSKADFYVFESQKPEQKGENINNVGNAWKQTHEIKNDVKKSETMGVGV